MSLVLAQCSLRQCWNWYLLAQCSLKYYHHWLRTHCSLQQCSNWCLLVQHLLLLTQCSLGHRCLWYLLAQCSPRERWHWYLPAQCSQKHCYHQQLLSTSIRCSLLPTAMSADSKQHDACSWRDVCRMYRSLQAAHSWVPSRVPGYVIVEGAAKQLPAEPTAGDK